MSDITSTSATTHPITLADLKRHLNVSTTNDDTYLSDLISAATETFERRYNRAFINQTRLLQMHNFDDLRYVHDRKIYPPRSPMGGVTSITYVASADGTTTTLGTSVYVSSTDEHPGRIEEAYNETWPSVRDQPNAVKVTYTAGYGTTQSDIPGTVKHAMRMLCGHWYRNREATVVATVSRDIQWSIDALMESEDTPLYG